MFFVFFAIARSYFVPFTDYNYGALDIYDNKSIEEEVKSGDDMAILVTSDESDDSYAARTALAAAASAYWENVLFGVVDIKQIPFYSEQIELNTPYVLCIRKSKILTAFEIPLSDHFCVTQINAIFNTPKIIVHSISELNSHIINLDYTIISRTNNYEEAHAMMVDCLPDLTTCGIIVASDAVFEEMGMSDSPFAIFCRDDTVVRPFNNETQTLLDAIVPNFVYLADDDFLNPGTVFAAVIAPDDVVADDEFNDNMNYLAEKFPNYRFGICDDESISYVKNMVDHELKEFPDFAVFNYETGFFYPTSQFQGMQINKEWAEKVDELLTGINNGTVSKLFLSDEVPKEQKDKYVKRIVGKTYKEFIHNEEKDSIIMYIEGRKLKGKTGIFRRLAHEFNETGITSIQFGKINVITNSDDEMPSLIRMPHIEYYKRGGNTSVPMFSHFSYNSLKRFIKWQSGLNITVKELTDEEGWDEIDMIEDALEKLPDSVIPAAHEYIDYLTSILPPRPEPEEGEDANEYYYENNEESETPQEENEKNEKEEL